MDPIVEEIHTNRAPTLQGTLFQLPTGCSDRIASFYGLPKTSIATISVTSSTELLYNAISEYAALVPPHNRAIIKPLFIAPRDAFESCEKKESAYDSDDETYHHRGGKPHRLGRTVEAPKAPTIKLKWALGETTVVWPPPPMLEAERLAQEKNQLRTSTSASPTHLIKMEPAGETDSMPSLDKKDLIYLVHYSLQSNDEDDTRVILMASPKATELCKFAQQVLQWYIDKDRIHPESTEYSLYRYKCDGESGYWKREGMKRARPPTSVILHEDQMDDIINDVNDFLSPSNRKWYINHGLPYRRCFLFYGPPGTGKTSTVRAISSHFGMRCYFLNMTSSSFSNQTLADAFSGIPARNALLVLEDVDTLFSEDRKCETSTSLTFSGLLNSLDGLLSADGALTVMTTNHIHRLDEALIRAGRVDRRFFFGHPSKSQIETLFLTFYPDVPADISKSFAEAVVARPPEEKAQNFATLQELFISCRKKTPEECIRMVPTFFKTHFACESV